jgi:hypothetical protein
MKVLAVILACLAVSCGSSSDAPTSPSIAQVAGVWRGTSRVSSVSGGECFATTFQSLVGGSTTASAAVTQSGSALNVTITDPSTGANCVYTGTAGASAIQLTVVSCSASDSIGAHCASGALRDIRLQTASINATVSGTSMTGTEAETFNVNVGGTSTAVGTLTLTSAFAVTRQ